MAREYGIPAVLGTGSATARIMTGDALRVDGDAGTVTLLDQEDAAPAEMLARARRWPWVVAAAVLLWWRRTRT